MNYTKMLWGVTIVVTIFVIIQVVGIFIDYNKADKECKQRCQAYCNCSITQDCPYTFDYDEVKGCDCDE